MQPQHGSDPASLFDAWRPLAGRALEAALNRVLALDPETRAQLTPLAGRRVVLRLQSVTGEPALSLGLHVQGDRLRVEAPDDAVTPDLAVRGTLGGLLGQLGRVLAPGLARRAPAPGRLRIEGDAELARHLQQLAQRFDPDWERPFAAVFGDVMGVQVAAMLRGTLLQGRAFGTGLARNGAEFLTEESRDVVSRGELDAFLDDVDVLRDDAERFALRVQRSQAALAAGAADAPTPT